MSPQWHSVPLLSPPQVTVSNPHSLGLQAVIYENGYSYDGNIEYRLVSRAPPQTWAGEAEGTAPPSPARSKRHGRSLGPGLLPPLLPRTCLSEEGTHLQPHQTQAGPDNPDEGHRQGVTCERLTGQDREPNPALGRAGDLCQLGKLAPQNGGSQGHQVGLAFWVWGVCKTEPRLMVTPQSLDLTPGAQDQTGWFLQDEARVGHSKLFGPVLVTCQLKKRGNKVAPHCGTPGQRQQGTKAPP